MVDADHLRDARPWHPMTTALDLKILGKFCEELNECATAVSRCVIQGIDEAEPTTGKVNRKWLEEEIADVLAGIEIAVFRYGLNVDEMTERTKKKIKHLMQWHEMD